MERLTPFGTEFRRQVRLVADKALRGEAIRQAGQKGYTDIPVLQLLYGEFSLGLDRTNAAIVQLPYEGGIMDQPFFEFQIWQIFLSAFIEFKSAKEEAEAKKRQSSMRPMRSR